MTRDELIEAGMDAAQNIANPRRLLFDEDDEAQVLAVLDAVEPLIRADERDRGLATVYGYELGASDTRADERARFADIPDTFRLLAVSTEHEVTRAAYLFAADLVATRISGADQIREEIPGLPTPADVCAAQREQVRVDLRAQVEALPMWGGPERFVVSAWVRRADVLALLDGDK